MTKKCVVPGCKSGYASCKERVSMFQIPRDAEMRTKWLKAIPAANSTRFRKSNVDKENGVSVSTHVVCEKHFLPSEIQRNFVHKDANGVIIANVPFKHPKIIKTAVPSIFSATQQMSSEIEQRVENTGCGSETCRSEEITIPTDDSNCNMVAQNMSPNRSQITQENNADLMEVIDNSQNSVQESNVRQSDNAAERRPSGENLFTCIYENKDVVQLPKGWIRYTPVCGKKWVAFSTFGLKNEANSLQPLPRRSVLITEEGNVHASANGKTIPSPNLSPSLESLCSVENLSSFLSRISSIRLCIGVSVLKDACIVQNNILCQDSFGEWRHKNCTIVAEKRICSACQRFKKTYNQKKLRLLKNHQRKRIDLAHRSFQERSQILAMRKKLRAHREAARRAKQRCHKLKDTISEMQEHVRNVNDESIMDKCEKLNLSQAQKLCVKEIIDAASRKSSHGYRYTEDWAMVCMLMYIRSPAHYRCLLKNKILPLPSPRTIRRYLSVVNSRCGFDANFFESFRRRLDTKLPMQKHGILLVDEISLREAVSVCSSTLTYKGLTDFGEMGTPATDINEKANHGLVLIYKAIADTYAQPIAVFASRGPVKGVDLTKIVLKAIILLENIGAKVHAIISDGAQTNRKMWSDLGISGKKGKCQTSFTHPFDETLKVFVLSDTPHLIKTIRNRLYNMKELLIDPSKSLIKWKYFHTLYDLDERLPDNLRVCPKITEDHLILNTSTKMRVHLATQIFSNSVANGLRFYHQRKTTGLDDCEATIDFCQQINDMFDSLNRKVPNEGVTPAGKDMRVLEASLRWLDDWESNCEKGLITANQFLTRDTAEGLRVILKGSIELCHYLCEKFNFEYVLTGKLNQDSLEQYFGTIRQAAGSNDHPATPTFLQLYKLLSTLGILKPPIAGNCTIQEHKTPPVLFTVSNLKNIYKPEASNRVEKIQQKLDALIEHEEREAVEIFEHDYCVAPVLD